MNREQKRALAIVISMSLATILGVAAVVVHLLELGSPSIFVCLAAVVQGTGVLVFFRFRPDKGAVTFDERDKQIQKNANLAGFGAQGKRKVPRQDGWHRQAPLGDGDFAVPRTIAKAFGLDDATRRQRGSAPPTWSFSGLCVRPASAPCISSSFWRPSPRLAFWVRKPRFQSRGCHSCL